MPPGLTLNALYCTHTVYYVARMILTINSNYFPIQHKLAGLSKGNRLCSLCGTVHVGFVVDKAPMVQVFSRSNSVFPLSISSHQFSMLVFVNILPLSEGQTGEAWEPSQSNALSEMGRTGKKSPFTFL
jgi:hypothetical protein